MKGIGITKLLISNIQQNYKGMQGVTKRLSSGLRINCGADDPSGLGIATLIRAQERGILTAVQNLSDGINMVHTIDSSLAEISDMIIRIRDLALTACNEAVLKDNCQDRTRLNNEAQSLIEEIYDEALTALFNSKKLLQGDYLEDIYATAGTQQQVAVDTTSPPAWVDDTHLVINQEVFVDAALRPSANAGDSTYRIFSQEIDPASNAAVGAPVQMTSDPGVLTDPDGDLYYDNGSALNDPQPNNSIFPYADPALYDQDGDGWLANTGVAAADLDNDDNDTTEVSGNLDDNPVAPTEQIIAVSGTAYQTDTPITWNNAETRSFTQGTVEYVTVNVAAAIGDYDVQIYDKDPLSATFNSWITVGSNTGDGTDQLINFGGDYIADAVRVVADDDVRKVDLAAGDVVIGPVNAEIYNDVQFSADGDANIRTYRFDLAGGPIDIDTIDLTLSGTDDYAIYYDDGTGPNATAIATGLDASGGTVHNFGAVSAQSIYVEVQGTDTVTSFDAWDAKATTGPVNIGPPYTREYTVAAGTVDSIDIVFNAGTNYEIFDQNGNSIAGPQAAVAGTTYTHAIGPLVNPGTFYVDYDNAAASITTFDATNTTAVATAAVVEADPQIKEWTLGANANSFTVNATVGTTIGLTINGVPVGAQVVGAGGSVQFSGAAAAGDTITVIAGVPASDADITGFTAEQIDTVATAGAADSHVFRYNISDANKDLTHLEFDIGTDYKIYDDTYNGDGFTGLLTGGAATAGSTLVAVGATTTNYLVVELDQDEDATSINSIAARNFPGDVGPTTVNRYYQYDVQNNPLDVSHIEIDVNAGVDYAIYYDSVNPANRLVNTTTAVAGVETYDFAAVNANTIIVEIEMGADTSEINSLTARSDLALGAETNSFADIAPNNQNAAVFSLDNTGGNAFTEFDLLEFRVKQDHDYSVYTSNDGGTTWTQIINSQLGMGTGAADTITYNTGAAEIQADTIKIVLESGNDANGEVFLDRVVNQLDRDGDLWPDSIEDMIGTNPLNAASYLSDTSAWSTVTGGPDDDGDGFVDYPTYYDTLEIDMNPTGVNPFGWDWTSGTGNRLDVPGGQFINIDGVTVDSDIIAADLPSTVDTDGDTIPDPLDPFPNDAEFITWNDGDAAYKGGNLLFISNRATPNQNAAADQDLYMLSGGTYSQITDPGVGEADNPALSQDGTAAAWDRADGNIYGYFLSTSCGVTTQTNAQLLVANGENPSWSPDNAQIVFERGGELWTAYVPGGAEAAITDSAGNTITGANADWSPDGDNIVYDRGGQIYVYNFVTETEYDLGIAGEAAAWSPDGTKLAYKTPGADDVWVTDLTIEYKLQPLQIGPDNTVNNQLEFSFPDARPSKIGLSGVSIATQASAEAAIDKIDAALSAITSERAEIGQVEIRMYHALDEITQHAINLASARSNIEDADMAAEFSNLVREKILSQSANAASIHAANVIEGQAVRVIDANVSDQSLRSIRNRLL